MQEDDLFVGVDVGSSSVRCAVVSFTGRVLSSSVHPIQTYSPRTHFYQQSSDNIWEATCRTIKAAMQGYSSKNVKGIGFDATCSLVILDKDFKPISVSPNGEPEQNIIMWMDHRAEMEAEEINSMQFELLKFVGGKISLEMQPPKLMWLKRNLNTQWKRVCHAFDLPDFLTWKATGALSRSLCSLVCKMMFQANEIDMKWDKEFWKGIGLEDFIDNQFQQIGTTVLAPGAPAVGGLCSSVAEELGLPMGTPVGTSMIDAHAGGIGSLGCRATNINSDFSSRLVMICGTSTCHMAVCENAVFVPGVWGPYYSAMVPGLWLNEAGQSAAGALIDHVINTHPGTKLFKENISVNKHLQAGLNEFLLEMSKKRNLASLSLLTRDLHIWPDFHGNRSPIADPSFKGMVSGLTLSTGEEELAQLYLATVQALAYGTRHILGFLHSSGHKIQSLIMCGGLAKNTLYTQMHADVTGLPVLLPDEEESVLLGAAILGAAATRNGNLQEAMRIMGGKASVLLPNKDDQRYHEKKYKVFLSMMELQKLAKQDMKDFA